LQEEAVLMERTVNFLTIYQISNLRYSNRFARTINVGVVNLDKIVNFCIRISRLEGLQEAIIQFRAILEEETKYFANSFRWELVKRKIITKSKGFYRLTNMLYRFFH
jgi:hypothetical protein